MNFDIEIRNKVTGRAVTLPGKQAVADFLAGLDKSEWEGFTCLGELPEPTQLVKAESEASPIVDTSIEPFRQIDATLAAGVIADRNHYDQDAVADAALSAVTLNVGDCGAGDSYLPADAAGEQA